MSIQTLLTSPAQVIILEEILAPGVKVDALISLQKLTS